MSILSREEIRQRFQEIVGEDTSDTTLTFLEDVEDTFDSYEQNNGEDWKKKYEENDASWRKKYRDRFFSGKSKEDDDDPEEPVGIQIKTFDELFKEG